MGPARVLNPVANDRPAPNPKPDSGDAAGTVWSHPTNHPPTPAPGAAAQTLPHA